MDKRFKAVVLGCTIFFGGFLSGIATIIVGWNLYIRFQTRRLNAEFEAKSPQQREYEFSPKGRFVKTESEVRTADGEYQRWLALTEAAFVAVDVGELEKAETYANELLRVAPKFRADWNFGNAVHKGNLTLGRLALRRGDMVGARLHLHRAAEVPGSPQLNSFGPNMLLAKEMFEKGERASLVAYFAACGKFWGMPGSKLKEWTALVEGGVMPDFGANLDY